MERASVELEKLVQRIQQQLAPQAEVLHNVRLEGRQSGTQRQIDVLVRERIGQYEIKIIIDCKDHREPVDVKGVEEFNGLLDDVGAQKGVLVCPSGFTKTAKTRAEGLQIDLYSPVDTEPHKWKVTATIPSICDFRSAAMSFGVSMSAPLPFRLPQKFYEECVAYGSDRNPLGMPLEVAARRWNAGELPREVGESPNIPVFDAPEILMDNGYGQLVPVEIWVSLHVRKQLYYGQLPVPKISGFKDELSGLVIANAFQVGLLDPETIEREWKAIADESEAEVRPVITLSGVICWPE
jgi:Restriction endonuclease